MNLYKVCTSITAVFLLTSFMMVDTAAAYRISTNRIFSRRSVRTVDQNQIEERRQVGTRVHSRASKIAPTEQVKTVDAKSLEACHIRQKTLAEASTDILGLLRKSPRGVVMYTNVKNYFDSKKEDCNNLKTKEQLEEEKKQMEEKDAKAAEEEVELTDEQKGMQNAIRIRCGRLAGSLYRRCASNIQNNSQIR